MTRGGVMRGGVRRVVVGVLLVATVAGTAGCRPTAGEPPTSGASSTAPSDATSDGTSDGVERTLQDVESTLDALDEELAGDER